MMITISLFIIWLICFSYIFWIFRFHYAWEEIKPIQKEKDTHLSMSVIIAIRNEAENLPILLMSLATQKYHHDDFEIIIVDDHSKDGSVSIIQGFQKQHPLLKLQVYSLAKDRTGKKAALEMAYQLVKNEIIACTDGDCNLPENWLHITAQAFNDPNKMLFSGGVYLKDKNRFLNHFQSVELMSLVASGAAAISLQKPIMCNGANMAFRKSILNELRPEEFHLKLASGDDVFLLMECKRKFGPSAIGFIKNKDHWVQTKGENSISEWLNQRMRWVSKSRSYSDPFQIMISILILVQNLSLLILMMASLINPAFIQTLIFIFLIKLMTDFFFLKNITLHLSKTYLLKYYPIISLIYPFFISYTAFMGQFKAFHWKGRSYRQ